MEIFSKRFAQPPLQSVLLRDILDSIESEVVILKIDLEGYECKALQPEILQGRVGKLIPYILMEWVQLPNNEYVCGNFKEWVDNFYQGGYLPVDPGEISRDVFITENNILDTLEPVKEADRDKMFHLAWILQSVLTVK